MGTVIKAGRGVTDFCPIIIGILRVLSYFCRFHHTGWADKQEAEKQRLTEAVSRRNLLGGSASFPLLQTL
jgi:hypothetical protein